MMIKLISAILFILSSGYFYKKHHAGNTALLTIVGIIAVGSSIFFFRDVWASLAKSEDPSITGSIEKPTERSQPVKQEESLRIARLSSRDTSESIAFEPSGLFLDQLTDRNTINRWSLANAQRERVIALPSGQLYRRLSAGAVLEARTFDDSYRAISSPFEVGKFTAFKLGSEPEMFDAEIADRDIAAISPDGRFVAVALVGKARDPNATKKFRGEVRVLDRRSGRDCIVGELLSAEKLYPYREVAFSGDSQRIAAETYANHVGVWSVDCSPVGQFGIPTGDRSSAIQAIALDHAGLRAAVIEVGRLYVWRVGGREEDFSRGDVGELKDVAFSPDGELVAAGGWGVEIIDVGTGKTLADLKAAGGVDHLAFSPTSDCLAAATKSGELVLWRRQDWAETVKLTSFKDGEWLAYNGRSEFTGSAHVQRHVRVTQVSQGWLWDTVEEVPAPATFLSRNFKPRGLASE